MYAGPWRSSRLATSDATRFGTSPIDASGCDGPSACWNWSRMASSRSSPRSGTSSRTHATSWWAVRTRCSSRRRRRREVPAPPDHHADPAGVGHALDVAGVGQGPRRGGQGQELVGLGPRGRHRHDAEVGRVERHGRVDEPAPPAVEAVGSVRAAARRTRGRPRSGGTSLTASTPATRLSPEGGEVGGAGEDPRHPDDGDRLGRHLSPRATRARRTWRPTWGSGTPARSSARAAATPSSGSMRPMPRRSYSRASSGETMPVPAHGPQSTPRPGCRGPRRGPAGDAVEGVVGGGVVDLSRVAEPARHARRRAGRTRARRPPRR